MLDILIVLQILTVIALLVVILRRPAAPLPDPQLLQLLSANLPAHVTRLDANFNNLDQHLRAELAQLRSDSASTSATLRTEIIGNLTTLSSTLTASLDKARLENEASAERLRSRVQEGLQQLTVNNEKKLEEMRQTVDEKLHATLQTRLTESFGQVTDQLTKVHAGLGEMTKLSAGVDDLSRIFTNVKSRGTIGEVMLETLLKQILASNQYVKGYKPRPDSNDIVEFAVKLPTPQGETFLPIDSKFPREAGERLESAYASNSPAEIASAGKAFETAIRSEGKKICEKYIVSPGTTSFAIMFLPTESLYAEVMRRDGLQSDIQQNCHVTIAGPSTLAAILSSFQMGFHMLQMQEKGDEVWKVLATARTQFGKFEDLMGKMSKDVERVQTTLGDVATRTRAINRTLRDVNVEAQPRPLAVQTGFDGLLPALAASDDE